MLKELHVKNFAIIDDVKIGFGSGLNILSGETGAGKTLIIDAINLLIGERADSSLIREGKDKLLVQGFFDFSKNKKAREYLLGNNILDEEDFDNDVVISRELNRTGKNKAFINGLFTQTGILKKLGDTFIDIHGQHDHQYLLNSGTHIDIVDNFGYRTLGGLKEIYAAKYDEYQGLKKELDKLVSMQQNRDIRLQDLKYKYDEISKLDIKQGEDEELENELSILKNYESVYELISDTENRINSSQSDDAGMSEDISVIKANMEKLAAIDKRFSDFSERIDSLFGLLEDISHFISSYLADFNYSRERLDAIQERLYSFSVIKKKYNMDILKTDEYLKEIKEEIDSYESLEADIEQIRDKSEVSYKSLLEAGQKLSAEREKIAGILKDNVKGELEGLGFGSVDFRIEIDSSGIDEGMFGRNGFDKIEFHISLNAGQSPRPLKKVASGGEVSRVMLAIKTALGEADDIYTMVFDEIDSGIGGVISSIVGEKLHIISKGKQVIVITHLAQIACFSDSHYFIDKYVEDEYTKIRIEKLGEPGKVKEISRMLGGTSDSEISFEHARELIGKADSIKIDQEKEILKIGN